TVAEEVDDLLKHHNVPLVFTDNYSASPLVSNVGVDDHLGGYLAGEYLLRAGHRRIAFVSPPRLRNGVMTQRYQGFVEALATHGLALDPLETFECDLSFDAAVVQGELLADRRAARTAIFAPADLLALGLIKGLRRGGMSVPADVSIIGFDDLPISRQASPELTTIHQDVLAKARAAVEMTLRLISAGAKAPTERLKLSVSVAERESVAGPRS
ncbi:MAG: substrate-binding domain-containing protein, partial [Propionicimonas sp.]